MRNLSNETGTGAPKAGNRQKTGTRNPRNSAKATSNNGEIDSSGHKIGKRESTKDSPARVPSRRTVDRLGKEYEKGKKETRDSAKVQSRGQAKPRGNKGNG
jgi:hypothetical protein